VFFAVYGFGQTTKCLLRSQAESQRDTAHLRLGQTECRRSSRCGSNCYWLYWPLEFFENSPVIRVNPGKSGLFL
jgi:hypothetical protein